MTVKQEFNSKSKIILAAFVILIAFSGSIYGQHSSSDGKNTSNEELELPDVTTVISGAAFTAGKDSVPDYTEILPENDSPVVQLPAMDGLPVKSDFPEASVQNPERVKDVFAEGEFGAGYPLYFSADFTIYRSSEKSPFSITFFHEGTEGFSGKKAEKGFFTRKTGVSGEKSYFGDNGNHRFFASYSTFDDGLQLKSDSYTDVVKHSVDGGFSSEWNLPKGFSISYGSDGNWYRRYGQRFSGGKVYKDCESTTMTVSADPFLQFAWGANFGLDIFLRGKYGFQGNLDDGDNLYKIDGSWNKNYSHRGQFTLGTSWKNDFIKLLADGSIIIGTATGERDLVPAFTGGVDLRFDFLKLAARGGIDSYQEKISELEQKYKYAYSPFIPTETTDWFAEGNITLPVGSFLEISGGAEFRKTAFGNGIWSVDYDKKNRKSSGLYIIGYSDGDEADEERTDVSTNAVLSANLNIVKLLAGWKSYWKDVPVLCDKHNIFAKASVEPDSQRWNAGTSARFAFGKGADKCPDLGAWAEFRFLSSLGIAVEIEDAIKLFRQQTREYADSGYIEKAGCAKLLVKFQF